MTNKNPAAQALGKLGGKMRTESKAEASRRNGALGGRPPQLLKDTVLFLQRLSRSMETSDAVKATAAKLLAQWEQKRPG